MTGLRFTSAGLHVILPHWPFLRAGRRFPRAGRYLARADRPIRPLFCRDRQSSDHLAAGWRGGDRPGLRRDVRLCRVLFCDPACPGCGDGRERRRWHFLRPQARHAGRQHRMRYRRGRLPHGARARHPPGQRCWPWPRCRTWVILDWPLGPGGAAMRRCLCPDGVQHAKDLLHHRLGQHRRPSRRPRPQPWRITSRTPGERRNVPVFCHPANPLGRTRQRDPCGLDWHTTPYETIGKPSCYGRAT